MSGSSYRRKTPLSRTEHLQNAFNHLTYNDNLVLNESKTRSIAVDIATALAEAHHSHKPAKIETYLVCEVLRAAREVLTAFHMQGGDIRLYRNNDLLKSQQTNAVQQIISAINDNINCL